MTTARRIFKNFLSLSTAEVLSRFVGFITIAYLARVLGAGAFGKISFVEAILSYFLIITNLGLNWVGTREVARHKENKDQIINTILILKFTLFFIAFVFLLIFIFFIRKPSDIKLLLFLYGLTLLPASLLIDWAFNGLEKMEYTAATNVIAKSIFMVLVFLIIKSASQIFIIPIIKLITDILIVVNLILIFNKVFGKIKFSFNKKVAINLLKMALPLGFSLYMIRIYYNFDTIMLGFMKDNETVGYYNAAYKIILVLIAFASAFYSAIFPVISNYYKSSIEKLKNFQTKITKILISVAIPLGVGTTLLASRIINFVYGYEYFQGAVALQLLIWAVVIIFIDIPFANSLVAVDRQNKFTIFVTMSAVINLILNFLLIPTFGIIGASIATIIAELNLLILSYIEMKKIVSINPFVFMGRPILASIILGIFISLFSPYAHLLIVVFVSMTVYFFALYIFKGITTEDIQFVRDKILKSQ